MAHAQGHFAYTVGGDLPDLIILYQLIIPAVKPVDPIAFTSLKIQWKNNNPKARKHFTP